MKFYFEKYEKYVHIFKETQKERTQKIPLKDKQLIQTGAYSVTL